MGYMLVHVMVSERLTLAAAAALSVKDWRAWSDIVNFI